MTVLLLGVGILLFLFVLYIPFPYVFSKWKRRALRKKARGKIALTFDDGPCPGMTYKILDLLDAFGVKATFFILGRRLEGREKILEEVLRRGHEVGGHGFGHIHYWKVLPWKATADIEHCSKLLHTIAGKGPRPFRPPYGKLNLWSLAYLLKKKQPLVWWTVDSGDTWTPKPPATRVGDLLLREGGGVVLLHDLDRKNPKDEEWTLECIQQTLSRIKKERPEWKIGTISELGLP